MLNKIVVASVATAVFIVATHVQAKADFTICNQATYGPLMVATAYEYTSGSDTWSRSEGFYTVPQGECRTTLDSLTGYESVYLFAWATTNQSIFWSGTSTYSSNAKQFCVDGNSSAFLYKADDAEPPCSYGVMRTFRYAGTADDAGDLTYTLQN